MKNIIFLAEENYMEIGPEKTIICGMKKVMEKEFEVSIVKCPISCARRKNKKCVMESVQKVRDKMNDNTYAVIVFSCTICYYMIPYFQKMQYSGIPVVAYLGDCNARGFAAEFKYMKDYKRNIDAGTVIKKLARYFMHWYKESVVLEKYRLAIYLTESDVSYAKQIHKKISAHMRVIPYGLPIPVLNKKKCVLDLKKNFKIGYLGTFNSETIAMNLAWFLNMWRDTVYGDFPHIQIVIAGRNASKEDREYFGEYEFVKFIGEVDRLEDFYNNVDVVITTVPKEAGIITKVAEAFAYGKCVVGFRRNFAPIVNCLEGTHYLPADSKEEFLHIFTDIMEGKVDIDRIGQDARTLIMKNYQWDSQKEKLIEYIESSYGDIDDA